jgi:hypothetical protein
MKTKLIATLMLAGSSLFAGPRVFFGASVGVPIVPAPVVVATAPVVVAPAPVVVGGYGFYGRRVWTGGYWRGPAFVSRYGYRGFRR